MQIDFTEQEKKDIVELVKLQKQVGLEKPLPKGMPYKDNHKICNVQWKDIKRVIMQDGKV